MSISPHDGGIQLISGPDAAHDAFNRLRVSGPTGLFDSQLQYDNSPLFWETDLTGSGTATHLPDESACRMRVSSASGDKVIRQTRAYHRYQPGKSQLVMMTFVLGDSVTGCRKRVGYFDAQNGVFLEQTSNGLYLVRRSYASGAAVDERVHQDDWSIDSHQDAYRSGLVIDPSKAHILVIDMEWLGVGAVRAGLVVDGKIVYLHQFNHANVLPTVYMTTANLPCRLEIENTGTTGGNTDLIQVCTAVMSEGGFEESRGIPHCATTGTSAIAVTTPVPVLSIRPKLLFNSITNRSRILVGSLQMAALTKTARFSLVYGGTLTGASWGDVDATYSAVEVDTTASAISGGITINAFYAPAAAQGSNSSPSGQSSAVLSRLPLALDMNGAHPTSPLTDSLTLVAEQADGAASSVFGAMFWSEIR